MDFEKKVEKSDFQKKKIFSRVKIVTFEEKKTVAGFWFVSPTFSFQIFPTAKRGEANDSEAETV